MKKIVSIALLSVILSYSFNQIGIITNYLLNSKEITALFCVNKDKPEMHCNGKCHLTKELAKSEEEHNEPNDVQTTPEIILFYFKTSKVFQKQTSLPLGHRQDYFQYNRFLPNGTTYSIFHPPKQVYT